MQDNILKMSVEKVLLSVKLSIYPIDERKKYRQSGNLDRFVYLKKPGRNLYEGNQNTSFNSVGRNRI